MTQSSSCREDSPSFGKSARPIALGHLEDEVATDIRFLPFKLAPSMQSDGANLANPIAQQYGFGLYCAGGF
jgi:hypothetical protein